MKYYSFNDIIQAYNISKEALKLKCKSGVIQSLKILTCRNNPHLFKTVIPENELHKLEHLKKQGVELIAKDESQPDYYIQLWAKHDAFEEAERLKKEEKKKKQSLLDLAFEREKATRLAIESRMAIEEDGTRSIYSDYIQSESWKLKRRERIELDKFQCKLCGSAINLQVHHISYEHLGHEPMDDLVTLCFGCHQWVHKWDLKVYKPDDGSPWYDIEEDDSPYWRKAENAKF